MTLSICLAQLTTDYTNVWVTYYITHAYAEEMEHAQNNKLASAYNNVHRQMSAYEERTRRMPSVPLTFICVYEREYTLTYADAIRCSMTAL